MIRTILVPTDFSKNADNATVYAFELAKSNNAKIILLHAIDNVALIPDTPFQYNEQEKSQLESYSANHIKTIIEKARKAELNCECINVTGHTIDVILECIISKKPDLIIMGTKGAGGIDKVVFGINTSKVMEHSKCAVIAIPENVLFQPIKNITYCTNFHESDIDALKKLIDIGESSGANITLLHVSEEKTLKPNEEEFINKLKNHFDRTKLNFNLTYGKSLVEALDKYRGKGLTDLLGISSHLPDLTYNPLEISRSRERVYQTKIPFIIFHYKESPVFII